MKKYSTPDIVFESFSLSTSIAGNCGYKTDIKSQGDCYVQFGAVKVFTSQVGGCLSNVGNGGVIIDSGVFNGLCYHVPTNGNNVFMS